MPKLRRSPVLTACFVLAVALTSCHIPTPVFDIGVCTAGKLEPQIAAIKVQVLECLRTGEYVPCLESIGKTVGIDIVLCAVREFTGVGAGPLATPEVRARAKDYLATKGVSSNG